MTREPKLTLAANKFKSVIAGNAESLPLRGLNLSERDVVARRLQLAKPPGLGPRVIVFHFKEETVRIKNKCIEQSSPGGIRRLELPPVRIDTLEHFSHDLKASTKKLPDERKGEYFAAHFYTGRTVVYSSVRELWEVLNIYQSVPGAHARKHTEEDVIRNIEIITMPRDKEIDQSHTSELKL